VTSCESFIKLALGKLAQFGLFNITVTILVNTVAIMDEHHILSFLFFIFAWQIEVMVSVPSEKSSKVLEFLSSVLRPGK